MMDDDKLGRWRITAAGILISVIIAVVLELLAHTEELLSVAIVLIGTTIALQLETIVRFQSQSKLEQTVKAIASPRERADLESALISLGSSAATALRSKQDFVAEEAKRLLKDTQRSLKEVADGKVRRPRYDAFLLTRLMKEVKKSLKATTDARDFAFWESPQGRQFFNENVAAIKDRRVQIDRIFIADVSPQLESVLNRHREAGIHCYILSPSNIDRRMFVNMTIFDDKIMHHDEYSPDGSTTAQIFSADRDELAAACRLFEEMRQAAVEHG
jgi:hypothetical protein